MNKKENKEMANEEDKIRCQVKKNKVSSFL